MYIFCTLNIVASVSYMKATIKILSQDGIFIVYYLLFIIHYSLKRQDFLKNNEYGQSKADFISNLHISLKETAETEYRDFIQQVFFIFD